MFYVNDELKDGRVMQGWFAFKTYKEAKESAERWLKEPWNNIVDYEIVER